MADIRKVTDLQQDKRNANKGTERGLKALDHSLRQYGAGRSLLVDKHGRIIAGNKTAQAAADIGLDDVILVPTDGTKLVAVQRTDLDLEQDKAARELAYADNRVGQLDLDFDPAVILADIEAGVNLDALWRPDELEALVAAAELAEARQEAVSHKPSHGYDFRDVHAGKLAYRVEAAWRAKGDLAIDLYSGQGQLAEWYARRFHRVVRVDRQAYDGIEFVGPALDWLNKSLSRVALTFDFIDFDDEGSPLREVRRLFEVLPAERTRPFVLCLTDGSGLNLKSRGRFDPSLYLLGGAKRQATRQDYDDFEALVTGAVERAAASGGFTAQQWSSVRGSEGNVLYQTYEITRRASDAPEQARGA